MKRWLTTLMILTLGCVQAPHSAGPDAHDTTQPAASEQAIWQALGDRVERGKVADTDELIRIVRELKADGDIADVSKLEAALPGIARKNQPLNETNRTDMAAKLRALR